MDAIELKNAVTQHGLFARDGSGKRIVLRDAAGNEFELADAGSDSDSIYLSADQLFAEIDRLRAGRFTESEFQNLCHNTDVLEGSERFFAGCEAYQRQLFGKSDRDGLKHVAIVVTGDGGHDLTRRMNKTRADGSKLFDPVTVIPFGAAPCGSRFDVVIMTPRPPEIDEDRWRTWRDESIRTRLRDADSFLYELAPLGPPLPTNMHRYRCTADNPHEFTIIGSPTVNPGAFRQCVHEDCFAWANESPQ